MRLRMVGWGMLWAACAVAQAQPKWIHMESPNFQVYSSAGERDTRSTLQYFEQVREFFYKVSGRAPKDPVPVYIIQFNSKKEFQPYQPAEHVAAYYMGRFERDYIVMGDRADEEGANVATHEYVHLVVRHAGLDFPPWFNEGLAELYASLKPFDDKVYVGVALPGRLATLWLDKWLPLRQILEADSDSPIYRRSQHAGNLYAQGWALTHMLAVSVDYAPKWQQFLDAMVKGGDSVEILERVYGKPLAEIEKDLQFYANKTITEGRVNVYPFKLTKLTDKFKATPADPFDVELALTNISFDPGKEAQVRTRLEALTKLDPKRPEPWSGLGYLSWMGGNRDGAVTEFGMAFELGDRSPKMLRDYGQLAMGTNVEQSIQALSALLNLNPDDRDVRIELAAAQLYGKQPVQAQITLNKLTNISQKQAPRVFSLAAQAAIQTNKFDEARAAALKWKEYAKDDADRDRAQQMIDFLDRRAAVEAANKERAEQQQAALTQREAQRQAALAQQQAEAEAYERARAATRSAQEGAPGADTGADTGANLGGRPTLQRRNSTGAANPELTQTLPSNMRLSTAGMFTELVCMGGEALMLLQTDEGVRRFLILEPDGIVITGGSAKLDLACGKQPKPIKMRIEFRLPPEGREDQAYGELRAVHLE